MIDILKFWWVDLALAAVGLLAFFWICGKIIDWIDNTVFEEAKKDKDDN